MEVQALLGNCTMLNRLNTFGDFRVELDSAWQRAVHNGSSRIATRVSMLDITHKY